jgi:hypothetical protein
MNDIPAGYPLRINNNANPLLAALIEFAEITDVFSTQPTGII